MLQRTGRELVFRGLILRTNVKQWPSETRAQGDYHPPQLDCKRRRAIDFFFLLQIFHCLIGSDTDG